MRVLLVEDDVDLADTLRDGLVEDGYAVDVSYEGEDGLWRATTVDYDAVLLDVMLPNVDGLTILRRMRESERRAPVLLLTARDATDDVVSGLDAGADDYVIKPFSWDELLARLRALIRRGPHGAEGSLRCGDLELDPAAHAVRVGDRPLVVTAKEFQILHLLLRKEGQALSRTEIIERVYDDDYDGMSNVIDVLVGRLRRKLKEASATPCIRTLRGVGYALERGSDA